MLNAKLINNIWATRKSDSLNGFKFMLAEVIGGSDEGKHLIVVDTVGAGIGDRVMIATGSAARRMVSDDKIPIDAAVIGIIDENSN